MQYCQLKKIPNVDLDDIFTGNGASELIQLALETPKKVEAKMDELRVADALTEIFGVFFEGVAAQFQRKLRKGAVAGA